MNNDNEFFDLNSFDELDSEQSPFDDFFGDDEDKSSIFTPGDDLTTATPAKETTKRPSRLVKTILLGAAILATVVSVCVALSAARPYTVDVVANLREPDAISGITVGAPVVCNGAIVGKVRKLGRNEFNDYARLELSSVPRKDAKFRIGETTSEGTIGVVIEDGSELQALPRKTTIVLSEPKKASEKLAERVKQLIPISPTQKAKGKTSNGAALVGVLSLGVCGYLLRKSLRIVALVGASLGGAVLAFRTFPQIAVMIDQLKTAFFNVFR